MNTEATASTAEIQAKKTKKSGREFFESTASSPKQGQGLTATLVGVLISLINAIIQYLLIYWVLDTYGTEFNGFIRLTASLTIVGGTTEGALGISTVVMMMRPLSRDDFITANEIFSTARTKYKNGMISKSIFVILIAILYPLEIVIAPALMHGGTVNWDITLVKNQTTNIPTAPIWELMLIVLCFGFKNVFTAGFFGAYENVIQADQKNGLRRLVVLFSDIVVYGILFYLLNITVDGNPLPPIYPFLILMAYAPIRGALIMLYVKKKYKWLKYYPEFNNWQLKKNSGRLFWTNMGQSILFNADIIVVMLVLGAYGLRVESMLSLYLVIGVNTRLIMTNFITSFREYFVAVLVKDGRLYWEAYSKYELYMYAVSAFTFLIMAVLGPYLVSALYGNVVDADMKNLQDIIYYQKGLQDAGQIVNQNVANLNVNALSNAEYFMFKDPRFSSMYAASTTLILMVQGQYTLIQAKGRVEQVSKISNVIAIVYLVVTFLSCLGFTIPQKGDNFIVYTLILYYGIKILTLIGVYGFFWWINYQRGTYNSSSKHVVQNLLVLGLPILIGELLNFFAIQKIYPLKTLLDSGLSPAAAIGWLILLLAIVVGGSLALVIIVTFSVRYKVAVSLVLMLPIVKQIVSKVKNKAKYERLRDENIDISKIPSNELAMQSGLPVDTSDFNIDVHGDMSGDLEEVFKPKIYKLKPEEKDTKQEG